MDQDTFKVDFIGIGAKRSGTTWLYECLKAHPEICVSRHKETNFFSPEYQDPLKTNHYRDYFTHCSHRQVIGEYSPIYLYSKHARQEIVRRFPNVKLLVILRNPVERALSHFYFLRSLDKGAHTIEDEIREDRHGVLEEGFYYKHLKPYLETFTRSQILICIYEDIESDPHAFLTTVYNFLGVETSFRPPSLSERVNPTARSRRRIPYLRRVVLRTQRYVREHTWLNWIRTLIRFCGINKLLKQLMEWNIQKHPKEAGEYNVQPLKEKRVSPETRARLAKAYRADIAQLERLLQRNLDFWR